MKRRFTILFTVALVICIVNILPTHGYAGLPEKIRVGLKFGTTSPITITASSNTGGKIGLYTGTSFSPFIDYTATDILTLKNDDSYHIQVGGSFFSYSSVMKEIELLKANGALRMSFYPMFRGNWYICTGFYPSASLYIPNYLVLKNVYGSLKTVKYIKGTENAVVISNASKSLFSFDGNNYNTRIRIISENPKGLPLMNLEKAQYRGNFELYRLNGGNIILVNELKLEEYLYSVIPAEMPAGSPAQEGERLEALKVQALTARTFAYNQVKASRYTKYDFDTDDSTATQVYGGYTKVSGAVGEYANSNKAVDQTIGRILLYDNMPATSIFYHSNDAGYKEESANVWKATIPYILSGPDEFTLRYGGKIKTWTGSFTGNSISTTISGYIKGNAGIDVGTVEEIDVITRVASGRVTEMLVKGSETNFLLKKELCRTALKLDVSSQLFNFRTEDTINVLYSSTTTSKSNLSDRAAKILQGGYFTRKFIADTYGMVDTDGRIFERLKILPSDSQTITVDGKGTGHGLGMSQDGAMQMAKEGYNAKAIIDFYYPGVYMSD